ncbi:MAG: hypothetical protein ACPL6C_02130, partial [bacterium]
DTIPPSPITDLRAVSSTTNSICLEWTATGDDSTYGIASSYELRYNTEPITETNWSSSNLVPVPFTPSTAGTPESF